ncbi:MAG: hypothetical protein ABSE15_01430 [Candidatus Bathyarchaeia archaeon]|jgi:hypothetical protein
MTTLTNEGDGVIGKRIIYIARKVSGPRLIMKGGRHRGMEGVLHDAEAYVDIAVET